MSCILRFLATRSMLKMLNTSASFHSIKNSFIHDNHFVLVDRYGRLRGVYDGLLPNEMGRLAADIEI